MSIRQQYAAFILQSISRTSSFPFEKSNLNQEELRLAVLNTFLTAPHEKLELLQYLHKKIMDIDPVFYGHLASWYKKKGESANHKEIFLANLFTSNLKEHRQAAYSLIQNSPPYEISRTVDYCKRVYNKFPRIARSAIIHYIRFIEKDPCLFDSEVLKGRKYLKHLFASLSVKPGERSQRILFDNNPPLDSSIYAMKKLLQEQDPIMQAKIIFDYKIPYSVAIKSIKNITYDITLKLISAMTNDELLESLSQLKHKGMLNNQEIRINIENKLKDIKIKKRGINNKSRIKSLDYNFDDSYITILESIKTACINNHNLINKPTALFFDKSGSMEKTLDAAKGIAYLCSNLKNDLLSVYGFDNRAIQLDSEQNDLSYWETTFNKLNSEGGTSIGTPLEAMLTKKERVEQIILITDERENKKPYFANIYKQYQDIMMVSPTVLIIKTGHFTEKLEHELEKRGINYDTFIFQKDFGSLLNLMKALSMPSQKELLREIIETVLPKRIDTL